MGVVTGNHWYNAQGQPAGGCTYGVGFAISWQNGPLGTGADRKEPNGAFVEDIIKAAIDRLEFYQRGGFACQENAEAIGFLEGALNRLWNRTRRRINAGTEGTHSGN